MMLIKHFSKACVIAAAVFSASGCSPTVNEGRALGAVIGATAGYALGSNQGWSRSDRRAAAALGAVAVGTIGGIAARPQYNQQIPNRSAPYYPGQRICGPQHFVGPDGRIYKMQSAPRRC